jgi:hypothetical protein
VVGSLRTSCERTLGALSKGCLLGILTGSFRTNPKFTHGAHHDQNGGYVLKELSICPLGIKWVNCLKTLNKLTMCLPGKTPSAPSESAAVEGRVGWKTRQRTRWRVKWRRWGTAASCDTAHGRCNWVEMRQIHWDAVSPCWSPYNRCAPLHSCVVIY